MSQSRQRDQKFAYVDMHFYIYFDTCVYLHNGISINNQKKTKHGFATWIELEGIKLVQINQKEKSHMVSLIGRI